MARPKKKDPTTGENLYDPQILAKKIRDYTATAKPYPVMSKFLYTHKLSKSRFYGVMQKSLELTEAVEMLHARAEYIVEYGIVTGKIQSTFGIFKLKQKQYGWTDKVENEVDNKPVVNINIPSRIDKISTNNEGDEKVDNKLEGNK